jgi:hypothetical protein
VDTFSAGVRALVAQTDNIVSRNDQPMPSGLSTVVATVVAGARYLSSILSRTTGQKLAVDIVQTSAQDLENATTALATNPSRSGYETLSIACRAVATNTVLLVRSAFPDTNPRPQFDHLLSRIGDVINEPRETPLAIIGLLDKNPFSFDKDVRASLQSVEGIDVIFNSCSKFAKNLDPSKKLGLSYDEVATINLYTYQGAPGNSPFNVINNALRDKNRSKLRPLFPFLRLLLQALGKLPKHKGLIFRGIPRLSEDCKGKESVQWGFSSCSNSFDQMAIFLGETGERTMFAIISDSAKDIANFSSFPVEEEVLIPPCVTFKVNNKKLVTTKDPGLWLVHLEEVSSPAKLIDGYDKLIF